MKKYIYLLIFTVLLNRDIIPAQSELKVIKTDIWATNLIIKDSVFLYELDSLISSSICAKIKDISSLKVVNIYSSKRENYYDLNVTLDDTVEVPGRIPFNGYFKYNDYLFLWFYDLPPKLFSLSTEKTKLTYMKYVPYVSLDEVVFLFNYLEDKLILTSVCCP